METKRSRSAIIVGAGLVGLALARELHRLGWMVSVLDAGEPPASWAGAGMLAAWQTSDLRLRPLSIAAARLYPTWVADLERETYFSCGYRPGGTLNLLPESPSLLEGWQRLSVADLNRREPELRLPSGCIAFHIENDHSVDNRALLVALRAAVEARGIPIEKSCRVQAVQPLELGCRALAEGRHFDADVIVNAAGAWAGAISAPVSIPVRPRKGQMLALEAARPLLHHIVEAPGVYLVPRSGGRVLVGATLEDNGFTPGLDQNVLESLHRRALDLVPGLGAASVVESWAGFRPCAEDELPILGPSACPAYWIAAGHYRDGILLAPLTAKILAKAMTTGYLTPALDLSPFSPSRFTT